MIESWLKNLRVSPYVREMLSTRQRALSGFEERLQPIRSGLISLKEDLVNERPETADEGAIGQKLVEMHADGFSRISLTRFDEISQVARISDGESIPGWDPRAPYLDERTVEGWMLNILGDRIAGLWERDRRWTHTEEGLRLSEEFETLKSLYWSEVRRYVDWKLAAPEEAMYDLLLFIGGLNPEPALVELMETGELDAEDIQTSGLELTFVSRIRLAMYEPNQLLPGEHEEPLRQIPHYKPVLARAYEGLLERLGTGLEAATVVERYKVRAEVYRTPEIRELAEQALSKRRSDLEDVLSRDLSAYLYDQGIFALYRARLDDLEPDILSTEISRFSTPLLIEAKAYNKSMRADIINGVAQCISYLGTLSTTLTGSISAAHYVIFRAGGPLYVLPDEISHGRFRVYPTVIDLASEGRGRCQARSGVKPITQDEILAKIGGPEEAETESLDEAGQPRLALPGRVAVHPLVDCERSTPYSRARAALFPPAWARQATSLAYPAQYSGPCHMPQTSGG